MQASKTGGVKHEGYHRGWVTALTEEDFNSKIVGSQSSSPSPPQHLRALARDLVCTHGDVVRQSLEHKDKLLKDLAELPEPSPQAKRRVAQAMPPFPRLDLTLLELHQKPNSVYRHHPELPDNDEDETLADRAREIFEEKAGRRLFPSISSSSNSSFGIPSLALPRLR